MKSNCRFFFFFLVNQNVIYFGKSENDGSTLQPRKLKHNIVWIPQIDWRFIPLLVVDVTEK